MFIFRKWCNLSARVPLLFYSVPTYLDSGLWHRDVDAYRSPVYCSFNTRVTCCFSVQRFIMLLTEHLVRCETGSVDISTPWYKNCIERLQQIFLMVKHSHTYTHRFGVTAQILYLILIFSYFIVCFLILLYCVLLLFFVWTLSLKMKLILS